MDVVDIARLQFGVITVYHFLFVPITIGMTFVVGVFELLWLRTDNPQYLRLTKFFGKVLLINFAIGVVTGIVQEFQFGMNWSDYSRFVGDVFGAPLAVEGLLAFFLESTFLGLWIFGWDRLPRGVHAACMWIVHIGTLASSWFILAANSWMQNPVGYRYNPDTGRAELVDFWAVMTNKVQLVTFPHVMAAAYLTAGVLVCGISGWLYLRSSRAKAALADADADGSAQPDEADGEQTPAVKGIADLSLYLKGIRFGAVLALIAGIGVTITGDIQGKIMTEVQPMKMAAAEGLYESAESCAPFSIFTLGTPDGSEEKFAITVPCLLSFLATGSFDGSVEGINDLRAKYEETYGSDPGTAYYQEDYVPVIPVTYWSFRFMIGLGMAATAGSLLVLWLTRRGKTPTAKWIGAASLALPVLVVAASSFGWIFTEMGRQPWAVFGLMTVDHAVSPGVSVGEAWTSFLSLTALYGVLAVIEIKLLMRVVRKGPEPFEEPPDPKKDSTDDEALSFAY